MTPTGQVTLVSSPIGNLGDLSDRAKAALADADFTIVEDSRVSGKLLSHLGIKKPMVVLNDHASERVLHQIIGRLEQGESATLLTDAGTPCISDPGTQLIDLCSSRGVLVDCIPGPSAVTTSLALSGFFAQRFAFLGFLPKKPGPAKSVLAPFVDSTFTLVLFESPYRFRKTLSLCGEILGDRRYAVCRELTKLHQQVFRGKLPIIPSEKEVPDKGEFTLVIEGVRRTDFDGE
ncbi:MAG: 16S rRNA (cytidine(1402)-2'-O)-methyltransferase [Fimbriimonadaceae bacterium]|jgi:16S rRNA (cytidine1402-2'-O)-methyltransferase|nr:16S rRNA (cytidine(1402)-2'-O)-methyltransferase [Fimbriimonadaceae bacterium]